MLYLLLLLCACTRKPIRLLDDNCPFVWSVSVCESLLSFLWIWRNFINRICVLTSNVVGVHFSNVMSNWRKLSLFFPCCPARTCRWASRHLETFACGSNFALVMRPWYYVLRYHFPKVDMTINDNIFKVLSGEFLSQFSWSGDIGNITV